MGINTSISPESPVLVVLAMMISGLEGFGGAATAAGVAAAGAAAAGAAADGVLACNDQGQYKDDTNDSGKENKLDRITTT
jgi:hypothetical protein